MRVIAALVIIVAIFVVLYFFGFGRGYNACVKACQSDHCAGYLTADMDCTKSPEFQPCVDKCKAEHGD